MRDSILSLLRRIRAGSAVENSASETITYRCSKCELLHTGLPALAYSAPWHWHDELEGSDSSYLTPDVCVIEDRDFFIRCVAEMPIIGSREVLSWGVWLSQSRDSFSKYTGDQPADAEEATFGYLANLLPHYPETLNLTANAIWRSKGLRPLLDFEPVEHEFVQEWLNGISLEKAINLAEECLHGT